MIKSLLRSFLINIAALYLASLYIGGFHLSDGLSSLLLVGLGFTALHLVIRPILSLILGPINFLTLGLIGLLLDAAILYLLTLYFPQVWISSWFFPGLERNGLIIPAFNFGVLETTIISAAAINLVRGALESLASS